MADIYSLWSVLVTPTGGGSNVIVVAAVLNTLSTQQARAESAAAAFVPGTTVSSHDVIAKLTTDLSSGADVDNSGHGAMPSGVTLGSPSIGTTVKYFLGGFDTGGPRKYRTPILAQDYGGKTAADLVIEFLVFLLGTNPYSEFALKICAKVGEVDLVVNS